MQRTAHIKQKAKRSRHLTQCCACHQPNWSFNVDANKGHACGIFMALIGTLRTSCSGAS